LSNLEVLVSETPELTPDEQAIAATLERRSGESRPAVEDSDAVAEAVGDDTTATTFQHARSGADEDMPVFREPGT